MKVLRSRSAERDTARITATIPAALAQEVEELKAAADAKGLEFPVSEIVAAALSKAVKAARRELESAQATETKK